jgi:cytochrome c biogenesis protein CcmG, thiol:disulfide interchange protein DsbE
MWQIIIKFFFLTCITSTILPVNAIEEGKVAPAFSAELIDGKSFNLETVKGEVVIINFWATWCPPCRQEMPAIESFYLKHKSQGLRVIAVSLDDPGDENKVRDVMKSFSFDAAMEEKSQHKGYGRIWRLPLTFVIDRKGILRKDGWYGPVGIDQPLLEKIVTPLLEEK